MRGAFRCTGGLTLLVALFHFVGVSRAEPPSPPPLRPAATCTQSFGEVQLTVGDPGQWGWLPAGEPVFQGDRVRTGAKGVAKLKLTQGTEVRLAARATVLLSGAGSPDTVGLTVESGELTGTLSSSEKLTLRSRDGALATLASAGAEHPASIRLAAVQGGVSVAVLEGSAKLSGAADATALELTTAQQVVFHHDGTRDEPRALLPAPELAGPLQDSHYLCPGLVLSLSWKPVDGARAYTVEVAKEQQFEHPVWVEDTLRPLSLFIPPTPARYFVRVAARDGFTLGGVPSQPLAFSCEPPAAASAGGP